MSSIRSKSLMVSDNCFKEPVYLANILIAFSEFLANM